VRPTQSSRMQRSASDTTKVLTLKRSSQVVEEATAIAMATTTISLPRCLPAEEVVVDSRVAGVADFGLGKRGYIQVRRVFLSPRF
jgi:hypothetical protein